MENVKPFQLPTFLKTLYLFTLSDIKTFVMPQTAFGLFSALSGSSMTTNAHVSVLNVFSRTPQVLVWTWLNTLLFTFSNQRMPEAVKEDKINKPYRPLAAGRIDGLQTRRLLLVCIPIVFLATLLIGATEETVLLTCLNWMYNELGGSDENYIVRNLILAATYAGYCSGAVRVAIDSEHTVHVTAYEWVAVIAGVILTTMHVQDLKDQEGDKARGRKTAPLVLGDTQARWSIAVPVLLWSVFCPAFWSLRLHESTLTVVLGLVVVYRVIMVHGVSADRLTWKVWSLWLTSLYLLPVFKNQAALSSVMRK